MKFRNILLMLMFFINSTYADPWHGYAKITHIYPSTSGMIFMISSPLVEYSSCDNGKRFSISINHPNYDAMVSALLLVYAADKSININLDPISSATCAPTINRFIAD